MGHAKFVHESGAFDIVGAVARDLQHEFLIFGFLVVLPPAQGIEATGGFSHAESGGGGGVEFETEAKYLLEIDHHV